jgi:hypothetical protein
MNENSPSLFVITRFGIGQSSENFYNQEFPYLENLLIKSILNQKKLITKWIIIIDVNTPKYVSEKLKKLIPKDLLYIYSHDIFSNENLKNRIYKFNSSYKELLPDISAIFKDLGVNDNDKVITIRIDADDMLSNDYISSVIREINSDDLQDNYKLILVNANYGVQFYPIKNKLVRVFKKNYSIQTLYSIFGKNFISVYDCGHQEMEQMVLNKGGICRQLGKEEFWLRSMRQNSVSQLGKKFGVLFGRFDLIKNIIRNLFPKFFLKNLLYRGQVNTDDLSQKFELSDKLIAFFYKHEKNLETKKIIFSPMLKEIIGVNNKKNKTAIQKILLDMYKKETDEDKRIKIKNEFYNF